MRIKTIGNRIDLGCGGNKKDDCIGIDKRDFGQEIVWDVRKGFPFPDNSIDYIYSAHFFEHLTLPEINKVCWDIKRIASDNCVLELIVPINHPDIAHYSYWDKRYLEGLCSSWGVKIEEVSENNNELKAIIKI